jgi:hypothetical protein
MDWDIKDMDLESRSACACMCAWAGKGTASRCKGELDVMEKLGDRGVQGVLVLVLVLVVTYACLRVLVPLCASRDFSASSWCTAVEKRRQKLGSWTTILADACACACACACAWLLLWWWWLVVVRWRAESAERGCMPEAATFVVRGRPVATVERGCLRLFVGTR